MKAIKSFFARILDFFRSDSLERRLAQAYDILSVVLPVVETIARLTPTRADDELLAVASRYLLAMPTGPMSDAEKSAYLRDVAATVARKRLTDLGVPDSVLHLAIELAVNIIKAGK